MKLNVVDTIMVLLKTLITAGFEKMWLNCHIDIGSQFIFESLPLHLSCCIWMESERVWQMSRVGKWNMNRRQLDKYHGIQLL